MDLDRFKEINDSLGHFNGDRVIERVGERLKVIVREGDTVARLGGDEFAMLLPTSPMPRRPRPRPSACTRRWRSRSRRVAWR